ncbi:VanZ family protein [Paenibacillus turpanensis]|uniref:VanZ family protein n=1 Tax=Paenibacillus turpanensis TaxID=2689078 RepID=UPI0014085065
MSICWIAVIFYFSSQSYYEQTIIPQLQSWLPAKELRERVPDLVISYDHVYVNAKKNPYGFIEFIFRKLSHLFVYAVLGCFFMLLFRFRIAKNWLSILFTLVLCMVVAGLDEVNQLDAVKRTPSIVDVGIDAAGAMIGVMVALLVQRIYARNKRE